MADAKIEHANKGPLSKKQRKKLKKEQNKNQSGQNPVSNDSKKSKDSNKNRTMKTEQHNNSKKGKSAHEETAVKDSGSSRVCVQSAGNGNAEQEATGPGLHFQMLRLPPGITITKVEGPTVARKLNISVSELERAMDFIDTFYRMKRLQRQHTSYLH